MLGSKLLGSMSAADKLINKHISFPARGSSSYLTSKHEHLVLLFSVPNEAPSHLLEVVGRWGRAAEVASRATC